MDRELGGLNLLMVISLLYISLADFCTHNDHEQMKEAEYSMGYSFIHKTATA